MTLNYCLFQDDFGETALVAAVNRGHTHIVDILMKNGSNVNQRNKVRVLITVSH